MCGCWEMEPKERPSFSLLQQLLSKSFGECVNSFLSGGGVRKKREKKRREGKERILGMEGVREKKGEGEMGRVIGRVHGKVIESRL